MPFEDDPEASLVEERLVNKNFGSEAEALDFAEQHLQAEMFETLRNFVQQGYLDSPSLHRLQDDQGPQQALIAHILYGRWCLAFQHPRVLLDTYGVIHIYQSAKSLRLHQIEALEALGWVWEGLEGDLIILLADRYNGTAEDAIRQALIIMGPAFKFFPPPKPPPPAPTTAVKSRYERLIEDSPV